MSGLVGAVVEAWDELRIHKLRVLLSLIGVAIAVTAITGITAAVDMMSQSFKEQAERSSGRATTLTLNLYSMSGAQLDPAATSAELTRVVDRYGIDYASRTAWGSTRFRFPAGTLPVNLQAVDVDYATIQRIQPVDGRWFTDQDTLRLAPAVVVNEAFMRELGATSTATHPTVVLAGGSPVRTEVVGVLADQWTDEPATAYLLYDDAVAWDASTWDLGPPQVAVWVPPAMADELRGLLSRDLQAAMPGVTVDVWDNSQNWGTFDQATRWVGLGVGGFALLLGGLGLVNIALVTVRHRIREIGIRRSFGATSGRVFFGVLMESVVATVVAGVVGVVLAVVVIRNIPVDRVFGGSIQDLPPFPLSAALVGMACAVGVGALAGLLPAIVAVRVKVIDAIRY
ncbi:ABC transporter permease [Cellulomonas hominis]